MDQHAAARTDPTDRVPSGDAAVPAPSGVPAGVPPDAALGRGSAADAAWLLGPLASLPGISKREAGLLARLVGGARVVDLLFHLPVGTVERHAPPSVAHAEPGRITTLVVTVRQVIRPAHARQPWRVVAADPSGSIELVLFQPQRLRQLPPGATVAVSGRLDRYGSTLRMAHPDLVLPAARADEIPVLSPVWKLCAGLGQNSVARAMAGALPLLPDRLGEWADPALVRREGWPPFADAIRAVQAPPTVDPAADAHARARLAYDELFAAQLALALLRWRTRSRPGRALTGDGALRAEALRRFGHAPTLSQSDALAAIDADLAAPSRMLRLLQGDVGSGKTLVALLAALRAVEGGAQAAIMAPTAVLAAQHAATFERLAPVPVGLLTGSTTARARRTLLAGLADGSVPLVVGTHALFSRDVAFRDLGLAVIDEQHRFGVGQRLLLGAKGARCDVLVMSATPIPRSLLLTQWGEMSVSRIRGKPAGRQPIVTTVHRMSRADEVEAAVARALAAGASVYWVCPLVAESEQTDLAAATERFAALAARFAPVLGAGAVGLAHGRQEARVRDAALARFATGDTRLLVATTVIEVGVDVPAATVMVVEHAERFGLAQLHQLRGRVGRGTARSFCLLLHADDRSETAARRLAILRRTEDGFAIADADYRLRGAGDALGARQSGLPPSRLGIGGADGERLLAIARRDADALLGRDPSLASARGAAARTLLDLFGASDGARLLEAG